MYIHKLALIVVFLGTIRCDKKIKKFKNREVFLSADLDLMKSLAVFGHLHVNVLCYFDDMSDVKFLTPPPIALFF